MERKEKREEMYNAGNGAKTIQIQLEFPISVATADGGKVEATTITLSRVKTKHMRLLPTDFMGRGDDAHLSPAELIPFIAALSGLPIEAVDEIDLADLAVIGKELESFFSVPSQRTGKM